MTEYALNTMSDATLPPLRPSSSADDNSNSPPAAIEKDEKDVFPFLVHSQDSVTNGEPPAVDNVKLAAQKRKRTSPEDQAILEAEYKANPKPDKAARLEIVKKVSLGEKAVQIWFQNRRQNTRRKSRPLLPHEIAAFGLGGMAALSSDPIVNFGSSQGSGFFPSSSQSDGPSSQENMQLRHSHIAPAPGGMMSDPTFPPFLKPGSTTPPTSFGDSHATSDSRNELTSFSLSQSSSQPVLPQPATAPGYLANRRSVTSGYFGTPITSQNSSFQTPASHIPTQPSSCPERQPTTPEDDATPSASQVRLSMSLDGKASLVSATVTDSPPNLTALGPTSSQGHIQPLPLPQRRLGTLQRSQSALPYTDLTRPILPPLTRTSSITDLSTRPVVPRLPSVRSRDARNWEFCRDSDARDELTQQAENESSGSAIAAISLLRSTSNSALKANMNKRNSPTVNHGRDGEKDGQLGKRAKLGRAQSSLARLQGAAASGAEKVISGKKGSETVRSPGGDSDKENWVPLREGGHRRQQSGKQISRQSHKQGRRRILGEDGVGGQKGRNKLGEGIFEDETATAGAVGPSDVEVEKFMRGEVSPSKKGDLDCIQGLLSLSQGNWR